MRVVTEVVAVDSIVKGLVVSTTVAVIGALLFTHNVIIAALIFFVLLGTIVSSLAFFRIMGWELGIVEAISITVLVGLSVDCMLFVLLEVLTGLQIVFTWGMLTLILPQRQDFATPALVIR